MIKTIKTMSKQEKERYTVPRKVPRPPYLAGRHLPCGEQVLQNL